MAQRWKRIGILAGVLFVVNLLSRLASKYWLTSNSQQKVIAVVGVGAIVLIFAVLAFSWGRTRPAGVVAADLAAAALGSCLLIIFAAPLIMGQSPFANGAGDFFAEIWQYAGLAIGGSLLGFLVLMATGQDLRAKQLKQYTRAAKAKPKRV
ncbi:hypothetical protein [Hamadaea tsunoensis]|uniref:hypothetical protein n=1 Tax=Hamadaea tsunoensis TaxID=53368 RepID=UPI00040F57BA|nr:hypothetical protein [Hamadaea tsunoensis]